MFMKKLSNEQVKQITDRFPNFNWQENYVLAKKAYFKIGGQAQLFVSLDKVEDVAELTSYLRYQQIPLTTLGSMSNVLISDQGIAGVVLSINNQTLEFSMGEKEGLVRAGAGVKTAILVKESINHSLAGLEKFLGVPGTLGGALYNNAHYLNEYIGNYINRVQAVSKTGKISWLTKDECDFDYDHSRFQNSTEIIFEAEFRLKKGDQSNSQEIMKEAAMYRAKTQPLGVPSSGCIFQNTKNNDHLRQLFPEFKDKEFVPTGFLIDRAGLKGFRQGSIVVSDKHAAFFVNEGDGTASDVLKLIKTVKSIVKSKFGVELKEEVFYLE